MRRSSSFIRVGLPWPSGPPAGPGWVHELKLDGYRLQVHVSSGRVRVYTMNGANWTDRYPRIVEEAARIKGTAIIDAEVVCLDTDGHTHFDMLHSRRFDHEAIACAFDLLAFDGRDLRRKPFKERKAALGKLLFRSRGGIQYVEHAEGHGERLFEAVCKLGLEGIVSKRITAPYHSGPSKALDQGQEPEGTGRYKDYGRDVLTSFSVLLYVGIIVVVIAHVIGCPFRKFHPAWNRAPG